MDKINLCILFGGAGSEHDVSCMSVTSVLNNIDREKYNITLLGITKKGEWFLYDGPTESIIDGSWQDAQYLTPAIISPDSSTHGIIVFEDTKIRAIKVDVAFPVMHGEFAEDGTLQGLLSLATIPCVGAGVLSSALCMDKDYTHLILREHGIGCAKWLTFYRHSCPSPEEVHEIVAAELGGYPVFVKPANNGSSVGVSKVKSKETLHDALEAAFKHDKKILIEEGIVGAEVECSVMGNEYPVASDVVGEVAPIADFYDYNAKYYDGTTDLHIPARLREDVAEQVRQTALKAYEALGITGFSRIDFFVRGEDEVLLNEINTLPGFTHISMFPKLFEKSGVPYPKLIDNLIDYALILK